jgi:hypothetical protein
VSVNRPSKRNSDVVHRLGVRLKRILVLSLRRERTLNTLRFSFRANSASLMVPNRASSVGIQARRFSQHCGMFKEWRFNCTAYRVRPNIRATMASGLLPSSSISRLDQRIRCGEKIGISTDPVSPPQQRECGAGVLPIPHPGCGQRDGVRNRSIFPSAKHLNVGGNAD